MTTVTIKLWDDTVKHLDALLAAHAEWLPLAQRDDANLAGLGPWDLEMAVNHVLRTHTPREVDELRYSTARLKGELED